MYKYLWIVPVIALAMVMAGCHGEGVTTEPPTVTIQSPTQGGQAYDTLDVTAQAAAQEPGATIDHIEVTFAGQTKTITGASGTAEDFNVPSVSQDTPYTITVTAVDSNGRRATDSVQVTVTAEPPTAPPTVEITRPDDGVTVSGDFEVEATATPVEPGATIDHIDVTSGTTKKTIPGASGIVSFNVSELSAASVSAAAAPANAWTVSVANATVALTAHTITATAVDSFGATGSDSITVKTSGTATVSVNLSNTTGVAGFSMTINYDQTALEVVSVSGGEAATGLTIVPNIQTAGVIRVAGAGTQEFDTSKTEILVIVFKAVGAAGATVVDIDDTASAPTPLEFYDTSASKIDPGPTAVDGTVTVQ